MHTLTPILDLDTTNSMLQCFGLMLILSEHCMYRVSQKMSFLGKIAMSIIITSFVSQGA